MTEHGFHLPERPERERPGTHRSEQLASTIRAELDRVIARGLSDPRIRGRITITGVRVTTDLRRADISVSILPPERAELTMHGLRSAAGYLRNQIKKRIAARLMPKLEFNLDEGLAHQREIYDLIAKATAERQPQEPRTDDQSPLERAETDDRQRDDTEPGPANHPEPGGQRKPGRGEA